MTPLHVPTPLWHSRPLSAAFGGEVHLKMEALQPVGSFKIRGIGRVCEHLALSGVGHFISSSGGNAGYAVAYAGRLLGARVTVVTPRTTPEFMREKLRQEGADVIEAGASWDDAHAHAEELAAGGGAALVHPFEGEELWSGHATMIEECAADLAAPPDAVVVSVGGGGLLVGVLRGMHGVGWSDVPVVAVETRGADSFAQSVRAGELVTLPAIESIATTLGSRTVTPAALAWAQRHPVRCVVVEDRAAVRACRRFADDHRVLVEPACGAALAACYDRVSPLTGTASVVVVVCGGAGASPDLLADWERRSR